MSIAYSNLNHPMRVPLAAEVHSRPYMRLVASESLTHLAVYARENLTTHKDYAITQHETLLALCSHFGVTGPALEAKYFFYDFGRFRLKWENHTEFATYTFAEGHEENLSLTSAFQQVPLRHIPQEWLLGLQGKIMVAAHVVLENKASTVDTLASEMRHVFEGNTLVGSNVSQDAEIYTDFLIQADGFSRFVVRDLGLRDQQAGRVVQRLLEMETYRMMALLGLPLAHQATPILNAIENELAALTVDMVAIDQAVPAAPSGKPSNGSDYEQTLLHQITGLAARIERLSLDNNYRFAASRAYFQLVYARIEELREIRIEGVPPIGVFMERRLTPAMNTCAAIARRQEALAKRIANTNDLLRTRVGIVQEQQNRKILQSMNKRAAQQLRLQQAVEGLSVVAVSYYLAGLFHYAGKAAKAAGLHVNPDIVTGVLIPVIAIVVWMGLRRLHKTIHTI